MKFIDLSYCIDEDCMTCGTPWHQKVVLKHLGKIDEVGRNTHSIMLGSHTGTHMDAPLHFFQGTDGIDKVELEKVCGSCKVVDMTHKKKGDVVTKSDLEKIEICQRMLFRFDWHKNWKTDTFYKGFPFFSEDAAWYLIEKGLKVIALDTPSPDDGSAIGLKDDSPVHKIFLKNDITIIEYLTNTDQLRTDREYSLIALPLKLKDCDGSPARVIMMEE